MSTLPTSPTQTIPARVLEILRCQQTLQPLVPHPDGLYSAAADVVYPVRDGLVFMGIDEREQSFLEAVMDGERVFQTSPENFARDFEFLKDSSIATVDLVNLVQQTVGLPPGARGLELGAGSGFVSWLFAEGGLDMWLTELEANSLALGFAFDHPNLVVGKRIVSDATLVPFADASFDLVVCKEFAHHVRDKQRLFAEANRVLRPGGTLIVMEPVQSLWTTYYYWRHPDPEGLIDHVIVWPWQYLSAIRSRGFRVVHQGAYFGGLPGRFPLTRWLKTRANEAVRHGRPAHDPITWLYEYIIGASLVVLATKERPTVQRPRPRIRLLPPSQLRARPADGPDYGAYLGVLQQAARRLKRRYVPDKVAGTQP